MSVINATRDYLNKMLTEVYGMKALLMDDETVRVRVGRAIANAVGF
jgi:hypothetical protein